MVKPHWHGIRTTVTDLFVKTREALFFERHEADEWLNGSFDQLSNKQPTDIKESDSWKISTSKASFISYICYCSGDCNVQV